MVDVPIRDKTPRQARQAPRPLPRPVRPHRPLVLLVASFLLIIAIGGFVRTLIEVYHDAMTRTGMTADTTPVKLAIATEEFAIPANMIRSSKVRRGGPVERADLALYWPGLTGFSADHEAAFRDAGPNSPIVYATIAARDEALDSTGRLDEVYSRFFIDKPLAGPGGLVGRKLSAESGYGSEIIYFMPSEPRPFVARCLAETTPDVPATCLRDVNFGRGLSVLYRFNRDLLPEWRALDAGIQKLALGFLTD
jgi:hypothetical protein